MSAPNLFLLAAPRSGSTQLANWLASHPCIALPALKEPNFFAQHEFPQWYVDKHHLNDIDVSAIDHGLRNAQFAIVRDQTTYEALFESNAPWRCDASTTYLSCPEAPAAIARMYPDAHVIILVREPIERAVSHYHLALRTGRTRASLPTEIDRELAETDPPGARYILRPSRYREAVERVKRVFAPHQILELQFEKMIADPQRCVRLVAAFLKLKHAEFDLAQDARNQSATPRFSQLNAWLLRSGLKTWLRAHLPQQSKSCLKQVWFKHGAPPAPPVQDLDYLKSFLTPR